jgi:hypothetical protein
LEPEQLLQTDAGQGGAEALKQRLERLLDGSKEATKQRTDLAEVRGGEQAQRLRGKHAWGFWVRVGRGVEWCGVWGRVCWCD